MASLQEFLGVLADAYPDEKVRGTEFEPFLRDALVASPSHQFADVWLWDDWPGRDGPERGIDLVAVDLDGGLWGIQWLSGGLVEDHSGGFRLAFRFSCLASASRSFSRTRSRHSLHCLY